MIDAVHPYLDFPGNTEEAFASTADDAERHFEAAPGRRRVGRG